MQEESHRRGKQRCLSWWKVCVYYKLCFDKFQTEKCCFRPEIIWRYAQEQSGLVKDSLLDPYFANASLPCVAGKPRDNRADADYWRHIDSKDEDEMMCYVALHGPLYVSMFFAIDSLKNYKTGIWDDPYDECPTDGSFQHAITIVGFGTEETETGELMDYWLLQNRLNDRFVPHCTLQIFDSFFKCSWGKTWGNNGFFKVKRGFNLCSINVDAMYPILDIGVTRPLKPINEPTDCMIKDHVYSSTGAYLKSLCIDYYSRNYDTSQLNCLLRDMQLYKLDSADAVADILDLVDTNWYSIWRIMDLHIAKNATGYWIVTDNNPWGPSRIAPGNSSASKQSVCEYISYELLPITSMVFIFKLYRK
jgi:Papain family cysteine protease